MIEYMIAIVEGPDMEAILSDFVRKLTWSSTAPQELPIFFQ